MKALTVWQPWASLIMIGAKPFEFRSKSYFEYINPPSAGMRIVIHAGARPVRPGEVEDLLTRLGRLNDATGLIREKARPLLERIRAAHKYRLVPIGAGLGTVTIGKPRYAGEIFGRQFGREISDSDRGEFNWAWPVSDPQPFDAPIEIRGMQGFWNWPLKAEAA